MRKYIFFALCFKLVISQEIGENCEQSDGALGQCQMFNDCSTAVQELKQGVMPVTCGFRGREPIVCCVTAQRQTESISSRQCENYSRLLAQNSRVNIQSVIGGIASSPQEFKYMAALGYGNEDNIQWNCGGTLISDQYVLTAAHCISSRQFGMVKWVRLGDLDLSKTNDDALPQDFKVANIIRHPEYKVSAKYNDIALLMLDRKVELNAYVIPACLHTDTALAADTLTAIGWGTLEYNGLKSGALMKVDLDVFSEESCKSNYSPDRTLIAGINFDSQLCAGGKTDAKDTCEGDSGGPLLMRMNTVRGMHQVVGVTSFGKPCGTINVPGVYSRVAHFVPWIEKVVWS